jgi:hypothetical protein
VVVVDKKARVVPDALADFQQSTSVEHTLADLATDHQYGAVGIEKELRQLLQADARLDYDRVLVTNIYGGSLVVDAANAYRAGGHMFLSSAEAARYGHPVLEWIAEYVSAPARVISREDWEQDFPSVLAQAMEAGSLMATANAGPKTLGEIFSHHSDWIVEPEFEDLMVHPAPFGALRDAPYTQFTVGVPTDGLFSTLQLAAERENVVYKQHLNNASRDFGKYLANLFIYKTFSVRMEADEIRMVAEHPIVQEVWGYGWLLYAHAAAAPFRETYAPSKAYKNVLTAALRNPLGKVLSALRLPVSEFFNANYSTIRDEFTKSLWVLLGKDPQASPREMARLLEEPLEGDGGETTSDYLKYGLKHGARTVSQWEAVGMKVEPYEDLEDVSGTPLALLELRSFGRNYGRMSADEFQQYSGEIFRTAELVLRRRLSQSVSLQELGGAIETILSRRRTGRHAGSVVRTDMGSR